MAFQPYPACRYHYSGKTITVNNPEEDAALGGGWAPTPAAFAAYRGPRRTERQHDSTKWVDQWSIEGLSEGSRLMIKAQLLKAHAVFWRLPDAPNAAADAMRFAFDHIAQVLFDATRSLKTIYRC